MSISEVISITIIPTAIFAYRNLICIIIVFWARLISVYVPVSLLRIGIIFEKHMFIILIRGGLSGGLSVALALSLSTAMYRCEVVLITYVIVVFSFLVQGFPISCLIKYLTPVNSN